jgi:predicted Zn-dependent protease
VNARQAAGLFRQAAAVRESTRLEAEVPAARSELGHALEKRGHTGLDDASGQNLGAAVAGFTLQHAPRRRR